MGARKLETIFQNFKHNVKLTGVTRLHFIKSEWETIETDDRVSWQYLLYRGLYLLYFLTFLIVAIVRDKHRQYFLTWATNWCFLIQTFYGLIFFGNILHRFICYQREVKAQRKRNDSVREDVYLSSPTQLNIFDSITWLTLNVAGAVPYIVSLGYWIFVFDPDTENTRAGAVFWNLTVHGFNAIIALMDMLVIAIPIRVAHSIYTITFAFLYLLFSLIYEYGGGSYKDEEENPYIYSMLNWREDPGWAVLSCAVALIAAFFLHLFLWLLFRLRMILVTKFESRGFFCSRA